MQKVKKAFLLLLIILVSGLSGIYANRYLFPRLATSKFFSKCGILKDATSDTTIINKTEQIYVKEDTSVSKIASQALSSVVEITSYTPADKRVQQQIKSGTGMIVTSDGLILTHASAILAQGASYKVSTNDNNLYDADLLDVDSYSDLAFLKINASNLSAASFSDSDQAQPGEKVIAIGNDSQTYAASFASGILSSLRSYYGADPKSVASSEKLDGVFETDIANQTHYVGGPVVDYSGQIIAVTGMELRDGQNYYFQIPANKVKNVVNKEIDKTIGQNAVLGIYYLPLTKTYAAINGLPSESGALVYSASGQQGLAIIANSPAAAAGLKLNDIITAVGTDRIDAQNTLPDVLYKYKKGDQIELTVLRAGQELKLPVQL